MMLKKTRQKPAPCRAWMILGLCAVLCNTSVAAMSLYVAQNGQSPVPPYVSWSDAASNIQDAVNIAFTNATVWVGAGRYTVPTNAVAFHNRTNVVFISRPLAVRSSNGAPDTVLIDGAGVARGIAVVYPASTTNRFIFRGLTISNCFAMDTVTNNNQGGGMLFDCDAGGVGRAWTAEVHRCVFLNNTVLSTNAYGEHVHQGAAAGGALSFYHSYAFSGLLISNCVFRGNVATNSNIPVNHYSCGGAINLRLLGAKTIVDTEISGNLAGSRGGGIFCQDYPQLELFRCTLRGNATIQAFTAASGGAGIYNAAGSVSHLYNCLLADNSTPGYGGGICMQHQGATIHGLVVNSTLVGNRASWGGGGVHIRQYANTNNPSMRMYNTIVVSNSLVMTAPPNQTNIAEYCYYPPAANDLVGVGNITNDPGVAFVNHDGGNYRLTAGSPCVNAGTNMPWVGGRDLDGKTRIDRNARIVDMGCHEYLPQGVFFWVY